MRNGFPDAFQTQNQQGDSNKPQKLRKGNFMSKNICKQIKDQNPVRETCNYAIEIRLIDCRVKPHKDK